MLLITDHSNMCGIFQQQFLKYKVTMTTLRDEIEAGIATSFNCFIQCDFDGNQAIFMISIIIQRAPRATVFNIFA